jgi:predicted MFS family arabinose efflux permease
MTSSVTTESKSREQLLWTIAGATFLIFFQAYMIAPLLPRLSEVFGAPVSTIGLAVPAYLIAYGVATLFYGVLSDRVGRRPIMLASLTAFCALTGMTILANSATELIWFRLLTGLGASGVVPLALALIGDLFQFNERGRPRGWLFGAMAGGMAVGAVVGVMLEPLISWRGLFLGVSILGGITLLALISRSSLLVKERAAAPPSLKAVFAVYKQLLSTSRGQRTYGYVFLNAVFHSGVFTWLGVYLAQRYELSETGIGLALLGYGIPGFLLGPLIGRMADRVGRNRLIPLGLVMAGLCPLALTLNIPVWAVPVIAIVLSLGYDLTQPLLAGIVTDLSPQRGQTMGLNVFALFLGFGTGSLIFGAMLPLGFDTAFRAFGIVAVIAGVFGARLFKAETHR